MTNAAKSHDESKPEEPKPAAHAKSTAPAPKGPQTHAVAITESAFSPARVECKAGDTVTWTNTDTVHGKHSVKFADGSAGSGGIHPNKSWSRTFDAAGTYDYGCESDVNMRGTVVVS